MSKTLRRILSKQKLHNQKKQKVCDTQEGADVHVEVHVDVPVVPISTTFPEADSASKLIYARESSDSLYLLTSIFHIMKKINWQKIWSIIRDAIVLILTGETLIK